MAKTQIQEDRVGLTTQLQGSGGESYATQTSRFQIGQNEGQKRVNKPQKSREKTSAEHKTKCQSQTQFKASFKGNLKHTPRFLRVSALRSAKPSKT